MNTETKLARINTLQAEKATLQQIIDGHTSAFSISREFNQKLREIQEKYINPIKEEYSEQIKGLEKKYCVCVWDNISSNISDKSTRDTYLFRNGEVNRLGTNAMAKEMAECELRISQINEELECILRGKYFRKWVKFLYRTGCLTEDILLETELEETVYEIICKVMKKTYGSKAKMFSLLFGLNTPCTEYTSWTMKDIVRNYSTHRLETIKINAKKILGTGIGDLYEISDLVDLLP